MALKGDLASVDLAQVFQMLALNQKVGMLSIQGHNNWTALYFDHRGVTLYFDEHMMLDRVLAKMVRSGQMEVDAVDHVRDSAASREMAVVDVLLGGGHTTEDELESAFRLELEEEVYNLFFNRDARFEFFEGAMGFEGREGVINERFFFSTDSLIMEAARRIDEWAFIQERVSGPQLVFTTTQAGADVRKLDDDALSVMELIDSKRSVERLVEITGLSSFHVYKSLAWLLEEELIGEVNPADLVETGKECVAEGRLADAINLYARAIQLKQGLPEAWSLAAAAYEASEEYELATKNLKHVAEQYVEEGDVVAASETLGRVVSLIPTDLAARERIVELTVGAPEFKNNDVNVVAEGKALVDLYLEIDEVDRVRGILERLLREHPEDIELKKSLINVHIKANDTRRVVELYESVAEDFVRDGQPIEAIKYLQKILMIDRSRKDISERIRSLYELDERRRSRRRNLVVLVGFFAMVAALGVGWWFYEDHARAKFLRLDVEELLDAKQYDEAAAVYEKFLQGHPFTLVGNDAKAELARVASLRLSHEAAIEQDRLREEGRRKRVRSRYKKDYALFREHFDEMRLVEALATLEHVRKAVLDAGGPEDKEWAEEVQLSRKLQDLRAYLGQAAALDRSARDLLASGDWRAAREKLLELTDRYDRAAVASRIRIPVLLSSWPKGAEIYRRGEPLVRRVGDKDVPLRTPTVVFCPRRGTDSFELRLDGFVPTKAVVDGRAAAESHHVLTVVPEVVVNFDRQVHTSATVQGGVLLVGLRGGRLGIATTEGARTRQDIKLNDLREILGDPVMVRDRFFVRTSPTEIQCRVVPSGRRRFSVNLPSAPATPMAARDGRLLFVDERGDLVCLGMDRGAELWRKRLRGGTVGGAPIIVGRSVRVGTQSGEYLVHDLVDGRETRRHTGIPGVASTPMHRNSLVIYVSTEGQIVAIRDEDASVVWSTPANQTWHGDHLAMHGDWLVAAAGNRLLVLDFSDGSEVRACEMPGEVLSGPACGRGAVFVVLRQETGEKGGKVRDEVETRDVLMAWSLQSLEPLWEYSSGSELSHPVTTDGAGAYMPDGAGRILRFK